MIDRPILNRSSLRHRVGDKPLFLIDLGVPRNFSPDLAELDSIYLYNIDDLAAIAEENKSLRDAAAKDAELVIEHGVLQFERWRAKLSVKPQILDMRQQVLSICKTEVEAVLSGLVGERPELVSRLGHSISQKISHELVKYLHERGELDDALDPLLIVPGGGEDIDANDS
jgi:glutamyl-tRNA reductase